MKHSSRIDVSSCGLGTVRGKHDDSPQRDNRVLPNESVSIDRHQKHFRPIQNVRVLEL